MLSEWESTDTERTGHKDSVRLLFQSTAAMPDLTVPFQVQLFNHPLASSDRLWHHGAFVQDQIAIGPRWTLNIGVRWDSYSAYYPEQRLREGPFTDFFYRGQPLQNGYSIPAAPFGDTVPGRNGIIKYRAAFGPRGDWPGRFKELARLSSKQAGAATTTTQALPSRAMSIRCRTRPTPLPGAAAMLIGCSSPPRSAHLCSAGGVLNRVDPNIGHPYTDNMNVWIERGIRSDLSARLEGLYIRR